MWISLKLEVVIKRKSYSWDVRIFYSIIWNVIKSTWTASKVSKQTIQNIAVEIVEYSTFSSEILYRRLDFGINILDEPVELFSVQEIDVSASPTRKRTESDDLSKEDTNSVSLCALSLRKPGEEDCLYKKKNRRKSKN